MTVVITFNYFWNFVNFISNFRWSFEPSSPVRWRLLQKLGAVSLEFWNATLRGIGGVWEIFVKEWRRKCFYFHDLLHLFSVMMKTQKVLLLSAWVKNPYFVEGALLSLNDEGVIQTCGCLNTHGTLISCGFSGACITRRVFPTANITTHSYTSSRVP